MRRNRSVTWLQAGFMAMVVVAMGYVIVSARAAAIVGDINGDGVVNVFDLSILLSDWSTSTAAADLNHDGTVNVFDLSVLLSHWGQTAPTPAPTPSPTAFYSVSGNNILDAAGKPVNLHGVDRPSLEWSCTGQAVSGGASGIPASDFSTMKTAWNANVVRLAVSQDRWLPGTHDTCAGYQNTVKAAVSAAEAAGLIVIIDLHWSDQGNTANTSGQQCMPDQNSVTFWQQVAAVYKSDPKVWFELYNEPYPPGSSSSAKWSLWQNGGSVTCNALVGGHGATWNAPGMQALVNAVRGVGANNIIIAGGLDFSSNLNGVPHLTGSNIAYAIHIYRQNTTWSTASWDAQFGSTSAAVPVVATEFGDQVCDGQSFDQQFLSYLHSHNVGYTAWAWFAASCNFTSIVSDAAGTCTSSTTGCAIQADMKQQH
jgi:endoglucanase